MLKRWITIILMCLVGVPTAVYWVGGLIVGPYEGDDGILGMMRVIYTDALTGHISAVVLLASPLLLIGIWIIVGRLKNLS